MTGSVREQIWRRPRRAAGILRHNNIVLNTGPPLQEIDARMLQVQHSLIVQLMGRFPWFGPVDMLNPRLLDMRTWFVEASINILDMNGQPMKRVKRVCPDTLMCELYCRTQQGDTHHIDYYEVRCGGVAWFPVQGTREQVLAWVPPRFHQYVAPEGLCECNAKRFAKTCVEKQQHGSR
jgi:hypothetical protein